MFKIIIIAIIVTVVVIGGFSLIENASVGGTEVTSGLNSEQEGTLTVTVSGEVVRPGTYVLTEDSLLEDLLEVASGITGNADARCYYTDYVLEDGMSFYIAPIYDNSDICAVTPIKKVNVNSADKNGLMDISSIGTTLASAILEYRETASFRSLEEIKNVDGIGPATYEKVKDYITLKD